MHKLSSSLTEMSNPKLDLFRVPDTHLNYQNYHITTYSPIRTGITPLEFIVRGLEDFVDLTRSYFTIKLILETSDNKPVKVDDDSPSDANKVQFVYPVNNFAHSLIKQLNVRLNAMLLSPQTDTYAYKAYLDTLLNYTKQEATLLAPQGGSSSHRTMAPRSLVVHNSQSTSRASPH